MDEPFRLILLEHLQRYPLMETSDTLKLVFQSVFGPRHFSSVPTLEDIITGIEEEMQLQETDDARTSVCENLGGDFVRVSLRSLSLGLWTITEMAQAFFASFALSPPMDKATLKIWNDRVNLFLTMDGEGLISRPDSEIDAAIEDLSRHGVRPTHHSEAYRQAYHPHYRVIHRQFIEKIEGMKHESQSHR